MHVLYQSVVELINMNIITAEEGLTTYSQKLWVCLKDRNVLMQSFWGLWRNSGTKNLGALFICFAVFAWYSFVLLVGAAVHSNCPMMLRLCFVFGFIEVPYFLWTEGNAFLSDTERSLGFGGIFLLLVLWIPWERYLFCGAGIWTAEATAESD
jgi:hypothetical protein